MKLKSIFILVLCSLSLPSFSMKTIDLSESKNNDQERMSLAQTFADKEQWTEVFNLMYPMALEGNVVAQINLGMLYNLGRGTAQDREKAYWWFSEAAEKGSIKALNNLGMMYLRGDFVKQDKAQAIKIFERTARAKDTQAMLILSDLYHAEKNQKASQEWLKKAAELGNEDAIRRLGNQ